jgi:hypothetical protein
LLLADCVLSDKESWWSCTPKAHSLTPKAHCCVNGSHCVSCNAHSAPPNLITGSRPLQPPVIATSRCREAIDSHHKVSARNPRQPVFKTPYDLQLRTPGALPRDLHRRSQKQHRAAVVDVGTVNGAYGGLSESGWWIFVPALVGRTATSETHPSLLELPIPATIPPVRGKLVSLAGAFVLFDSHTCRSTDGTCRFCRYGSPEHVRPFIAMHECANRGMLFRSVYKSWSASVQRMPGSPPMLMIVNDVLLELQALARAGPNGFGRVSEECKYTEAN